MLPGIEAFESPTPEPEKHVETLRSFTMAKIARDLCIPEQFINREELTNYSSAKFDLERFQIKARRFTSQPVEVASTGSRRQIDSEGRDVTDLPGLWSETDKQG